MQVPQYAKEPIKLSSIITPKTKRGVIIINYMSVFLIFYISCKFVFLAVKKSFIFTVSKIELRNIYIPHVMCLSNQGSGTIILIDGFQDCLLFKSFNLTCINLICV